MARSESAWQYMRSISRIGANSTAAESVGGMGSKGDDLTTKHTKDTKFGEKVF
jgi:hypothetical protein